jgi:hypothetical protein
MTAARKQNSQEFSKTEQHEDISESTKGREEDTNSSGKRKSSPTDINHVVLPALLLILLLLLITVWFILCIRWNILIPDELNNGFHHYEPVQNNLAVIHEL